MGGCATPNRVEIVLGGEPVVVPRDLLDLVVAGDDPVTAVFVGPRDWAPRPHLGVDPTGVLDHVRAVVVVRDGGPSQGSVRSPIRSCAA
jgi:hypothetical protein